MRLFGGVGCVTCNTQLDFGQHPYHDDVETRIFKNNFYRFTMGAVVQYKFCWHSGSCWWIIVKLFSGAGCLASNKPFDLGVDPDPGNFNGIFTTEG